MCSTSYLKQIFSTMQTKSLSGGEATNGVKWENSTKIEIKMDDRTPELKFTAGGTGGLTVVDILSADIISSCN